MIKCQSSRILRAGLFSAGILLLWSGWIFAPLADVNASERPEATPAPRRGSYRVFSHETKAHRADCATCHKFPSTNWEKVRSKDDAFPDITEYPNHASCVNCHKQQFFRGRPPAICAICHTNPGPRIGTRHPFPNPRELFDRSPKGRTAQSGFVIGFPHDKHIDIVSAHWVSKPEFVSVGYFRAASKFRNEESCAVCHKTMSPQGDSPEEFLTKPPASVGDGFWLKKGTFKSSPTGHAACFTCHSVDSGMLPEPQNCGTCHKLKITQPSSDFDAKLAAAIGIPERVMLDQWRGRYSSGKFQHEHFAHAELSCSTCHNVLSLNTADPLTKKVGITSCSTCHATPTTDDGGALNFEIESRKADPKFDCSKCHITLGKMAVPKSHVEALSKATGN